MSEAAVGEGKLAFLNAAAGPKIFAEDHRPKAQIQHMTREAPQSTEP